MGKIIHMKEITKREKQENQIKRLAELRPSYTSSMPGNKMGQLDNQRKPSRSNCQKSMLFCSFF